MAPSLPLTAKPNRLKDGSDAIADWAFLNALVNTASGATWVSIHNGGGVGIGYSQHAGQVLCADGTQDMAKRIERVLTNDPGLGVARHADAGYPEAIAFAKKPESRFPCYEQDRCYTHRNVRIAGPNGSALELTVEESAHVYRPRCNRKYSVQSLRRLCSPAAKTSASLAVRRETPDLRSERR